jgi:hypothetical protein
MVEAVHHTTDKGIVAWQVKAEAVTENPHPCGLASWYADEQGKFRRPTLI